MKETTKNTERVDVLFMEGESEDPDLEYQQLLEEAKILETELQLPRGYFSLSQYRTYMRCGLQYEYRYIKDIVAPPGVAMIEGSAVHKALEVGLREKKESNKVPPVDVMVDAWRDSFTEKQKEVNWELELAQEQSTKQRLLKDLETRDRQFIQMYNEQHLPKVAPKEVESRFWTIMGPMAVPILGYIDLIDSGEADPELDGALVVDHKVVARSKTQHDTDTDLQLTLYSKVSNVPNVGFNAFVKNKTPVIKNLRSTRTATDYERMEFLVVEIAKAVAAGVFLPADPGDYTCSPKYCGYYHMCHGRRS